MTKMPDLEGPIPLEGEQQQSMRDNLKGSFFLQRPLFELIEV